MRLLIRHWVDVAGNEYYEFDNNEIEVVETRLKEMLPLKYVKIQHKNKPIGTGIQTPFRFDSFCRKIAEFISFKL